MDPESIGFMIGRLIPLLFCLGIVAAVATRAGKLKPQSRRLGRYGVACGLLFLPLICVLTFARGPEGRFIMMVVGAVIVAAGVVAMVLAAKARTAGKADGGAGGSIPGAVALGLVSIFFGGGAIAMPFLVNPRPGDSSDGVAWTSRVDPTGFEVTLPSSGWRRMEPTKEIAFFSSRSPQMVMVVKEVRTATAPAEFERAVSDLKRIVGKNNVKIIEEKRELNANGHEHYRFLGEESSPKGPVFVAMSATWWNKTNAVMMIFEGQHKLLSQAGKDQESQTYQTDARSILSSIK